MATLVGVLMANTAPLQDSTVNGNKDIPYKNLGPMAWARVATKLKSSLFLLNWVCRS